MPERTVIEDDVPTIRERVVAHEVPVKESVVTGAPVKDRVVSRTHVREHATGAQRVGILLAVIEAAVLGIVTAMHFGYGLTIGGTRYEAPPSFAAGIVDAMLALAVLLAVLVPGGGGVRAGRVLAAQILVVIGVFVTQVALVPANLRGAIYDGAILVLALASLSLISAPAYRRTTVHHHP